ncbi:hypothetical protein EDB81DRAFT_952363 [Dactylonectria macrodidyma]|uniref:Uncharacterized protein n=1 Tax=Dactylonectria macrodidyma TaxID=307937 RepID=A0A9P9DLH8_9HYPO|nr:hypothetical protein EDB81DRAFT_952363 [Dactylonectria macrodidyma]
MPAPYLFHVNLRPPGGVDEKAWEKALVEEYLADLVQTKSATRFSLYRESYNFPLAAKQRAPRQHLLYIQTNHPELLLVGDHSKLLPAINSSTASEVLDVRNYNLIQSFDPKNHGEEPSQTLLTAELHPVDEDDLHSWYKEEHLGMLSEIPGYCRSSRYEIGPRTDYTFGEKLPKFIANHYFTSLDGFATPIGEAVSLTPWSQKVITTSPIFVLRGWDLVVAGS